MNSTNHSVILNLKDITTHPGYKIDVHLMGPLTLSSWLEEVNDRSWQRDKAKELFVYFLLNREQIYSERRNHARIFGNRPMKKVRIGISKLH